MKKYLASSFFGLATIGLLILVPVETHATNATTPTPFFISSVKTKVLKMSHDEAKVVVTWDTSLPSTAFVFYGPTPTYGNEAVASTTTLKLKHRVVLKGLSRSTLYHFYVESTDAQIFSTTSPDTTVFTAVATST